MCFCVCVHLSVCVLLFICVCVCVQDPGRAAQQALSGRRQVNRTRPSSARSGRHPRLCRLHHGVRRQRSPAGAQSGAGIAWHPWQVCTTQPLPPLLPLSPSLHPLPLLPICPSSLTSSTLAVGHLFTLSNPPRDFKKMFFNTNGRFLTGETNCRIPEIFFSFLPCCWIVRRGQIF